jgi:hypothetical protein
MAGDGVTDPYDAPGEAIGQRASLLLVFTPVS